MHNPSKIVRLYERLSRKMADGRSIQLSAEDLDWFVVSGAYARLADEIARQAERRSRARLVALGYDVPLDTWRPSPADETASAQAPAPDAVSDDCDVETPVEDKAQRPILTVSQLAELWGCSTARVYSLVKSGELQAFRIGKLYRVRRDVAEAYQESQMS